MRITYYAVAERPDHIIGQLFVIRENGRQVSQQWTGVTYRSVQAALKDLKRLNCKVKRWHSPYVARALAASTSGVAGGEFYLITDANTAS